MPDTVAVLGASGFVGAATVVELLDRGVAVRPIVAPRLRWPATWRHSVSALPPAAYGEVVGELAGQLCGSRAVINAAGIPCGLSPRSPALYGANALLPVLVSRACAVAGVGRYVHVSTAAVQGNQPLDETPRTAPFSPYSASKALGERLLLAEPATDRAIFRATWVHAAGRPNTRGLVRLARSGLSSVAGDGSAPTPQVLVGDLAMSIVHVALTPVPAPAVVLQPHSGMTTALLLRLLGGREPRRLPLPLARAAVNGMHQYGRLTRRANAHARRLDMILFGRAQVQGWLAGRGLVPQLRPEAWQQLAETETAAVKV